MDEKSRQLIGNRYKVQIDSQIVVMKTSCESIISSNISEIQHSVLHWLSLASTTNYSVVAPNPTRSRIYGMACRVKYLVDTPGNILGHFDKSMFLESATRYKRAEYVHHSLATGNQNLLANFPVLHHQWQIVESFKARILQRSRERLLLDISQEEVGAFAIADALSAVAVIDNLNPVQVLDLFLDSRRSLIFQKLTSCGLDSNDVINVYCEVLKIIHVSLAQVGELFMQVSSDEMPPLFYKTIFSSPPVLFGGIPNPNEELWLWYSFRDELESVMVMLDRPCIQLSCSIWFRKCADKVVSGINGRYLIDVIESGQQLVVAEKKIRETLEGNSEWLKSVFGSMVKLSWKRTCKLVLGRDVDLWYTIFEHAFIGRMRLILESRSDELTELVNVKDFGGIDKNGFPSYPKRSTSIGGVWFVELYDKLGREKTDFRTCLDAYLEAKVRDLLDSHYESVLEDLLSFLESPNAFERFKRLAPYLQNECYWRMSTILEQLSTEVDHLYDDMKIRNKEGKLVNSPALIVQRTLFIVGFLFAFQKHSEHIRVILGSPNLWVNKAMVGNVSSSSKRQTSVDSLALDGANDSSSYYLEEFNRAIQDLSIRAHILWISRVSEELSAILSRDLMRDDSLSATAPLRGWEETVIKQDQSAEIASEMKISLPSRPSTYITTFMFQACEVIHQVSGNVLDSIILQIFASELLEKVTVIYGDLSSNEEFLDTKVSKKGLLQILLDLKFSADILSGGDFSGSEYVSVERKDVLQTKMAISQMNIDRLITGFAQELDPIDWLKYEPYLWENERKSYLRHAVLFGFFVQLDRNQIYTEAEQNLTTNPEPNIMRCSTDVSSGNSLEGDVHNELSRNIDTDDDSGFRVAAPFLESIMQVGSRLGESTLKQDG